jgi:hypothetical protein
VGGSVLALCLLPFSSSVVPTTQGEHLQGRAVLPMVSTTERRSGVLWTIFVILLVLWLLGMVSAYTLGGFIHVLLVVAIVILLVRLISGRPAV